MKKIIISCALASLAYATFTLGMGTPTAPPQASVAVVAAIEETDVPGLTQALEDEKKLGTLTKDAVEQYLQLAQTKLRSLEDRIKKQERRIKWTLVLLTPTPFLYAYKKLLERKAASGRQNVEFLEQLLANMP